MAAIATIGIVSVLSFVLVDAAPGDSAVRLLRASGDSTPTNEEIQRVRDQLRLDEPVLSRYVGWLGATLRGDLGRSLVSGRPVSDMLGSALPRTVILMGTAMTGIVIVAVVFGLMAGLRPDSWAARVAGGLTAATYSVPQFVVGVVLLWLFAVELRLLPAGGARPLGDQTFSSDLPAYLILPAVTVLLGPTLGVGMAVVASTVQHADQSLFVSAAMGRGVPRRRVVVGHVLRFAAVPFVVQLCSAVGMLVGGAFAVEVVFSWPGIGQEAVMAAQNQDQTVLAAIVLLSGTVVVAGNLVGDLLAGWADPRTRTTEAFV